MGWDSQRHKQFFPQVKEAPNFLGLLGWACVAAAALWAVASMCGWI